jgi:hypothetical protein
MLYGPHLLYVFLPILVITFIVQALLKSAYKRYSKVRNMRGVSGAEAAHRILELGGVHDVRIEEVQGFLSDHYDPTSKTLRLSPENFEGRSIAAVGVAAHEAGHAIQHARNYAPLALRNLAVPVASIGSKFGWIVLMIGLFMAHTPLGMGLLLVGVVCLGAIALFQLINLPVEFDASRRALELLPDSGILTTGDELSGARKVLGAAALTYVAATIAAIWELIFWLMHLGLLGGSDE